MLTHLSLGRARASRGRVRDTHARAPLSSARDALLDSRSRRPPPPQRCRARSRSRHRRSSRARSAPASASSRRTGLCDRRHGPARAQPLRARAQALLEVRGARAQTHAHRDRQTREKRRPALAAESARAAPFPSVDERAPPRAAAASPPSPSPSLAPWRAAAGADELADLRCSGRRTRWKSSRASSTKSSRTCAGTSPTISRASSRPVPSPPRRPLALFRLAARRRLPRGPALPRDALRRARARWLVALSSPERAARVLLLLAFPQLPLVARAEGRREPRARRPRRRAAPARAASAGRSPSRLSRAAFVDGARGPPARPSLHLLLRLPPSPPPPALPPILPLPCAHSQARAALGPGVGLLTTTTARRTSSPRRAAGRSSAAAAACAQPRTRLQGGRGAPRELRPALRRRVRPYLAPRALAYSRLADQTAAARAGAGLLALPRSTSGSTASCPRAAKGVGACSASRSTRPTRSSTTRRRSSTRRRETPAAAAREASESVSSPPRKIEASRPRPRPRPRLARPRRAQGLQLSQSFDASADPGAELDPAMLQLLRLCEIRGADAFILEVSGRRACAARFRESGSAV